MTFHAACYDSNLGYVAQDDRQLVSGLLDDTPGVFNGPNSDYGGLAVSAGSGMTSSVALGRAAVLNSFQATQGGLWVVRNDAAVATAAHAGNASGNPRWDCVGVRVYDSDTGGDTSDITVPLVLQGTASSSAAIGTATSRWNLGTADMTGAPGQSGGPALPNNFLPLYMALVPNGASSSASFSYLDWRLFITVGEPIIGGYVPGAFTQPTRVINTAYQPNTTRPTLVAIAGDGTSSDFNINIGPTSSPATSVGLTVFGVSGGYATLTFMVPIGWYYEITASGTFTVISTSEWVM